jgi:hypothetical protein
MNEGFYKISKKFLVCIAGLFFLQTTFGQTALPKPAHTVIVMFENKGYSQIVGSASAPYINSLLADTNTALLTQSYALGHPSQPNYLMLFSGSNQGVTSDTISSATPFTTCNLGASLIQNGVSFSGYCEDLPSVGYLGAIAGLYYRKHNPWSNWQGTLANNLPASVNLPFTDFPTNYNLLSDVSFVVPNINNCMHNGSISLGDSWLQSNLSSYIQWARVNNSLLILTFDEDNGNEGNRISTFFYGPMVQGGSYSTHVDHYNVLRTLEDLYHLPHCGNSATASTIDQIWKPGVGIQENEVLLNEAHIFPNPSTDHASLKINISKPIDKARITINNMCGQTVFETESKLKVGESVIELSCNLSAGAYSVSIHSEVININHKLIIE